MRRLFTPVAIAALMGAACAGNPSASGDCDDAGGRSAGIAAKIRDEWPLRPHDEVTLLATSVMQRLAAGEAPRRWRLEVVRNRNAEAYSIGGGRIYISDGTIRICESESELAAVLAHEMSHQTLGHFCSRRPGPDARWWQRAPRRRETTVGSLSMRVDPARELAADRHALEMLERAGYDPAASLRIARRVERATPSGHLEEMGRVERLEGLLARSPPVEAYQSESFSSVRNALLAERGLQSP